MDLLIPSGPAAFLTESEFRVSYTSFRFMCIDSSECLFLEVNGGEYIDFHQELPS